MGGVFGFATGPSDRALNGAVLVGQDTQRHVRSLSEPPRVLHDLRFGLEAVFLVGFEVGLADFGNLEDPQFFLALSFGNPGLKGADGRGQVGPIGPE